MSEERRTPAADGDDPPGEPLRESDAALARWLGASAAADTRHDVHATADYRADLHRVGEVYGRLELDLDRSGQPDEVWTLADDGEVSRVVAPGTAHQIRFRLIGGRWQRENPPPA